MIQQFTVVPKNTRIFKTIISNLELFLPGTNNSQSNVFVRGSFDSFRTFKTPVCKDLARDVKFGEWDESFMYETEHADLMLFKKFTLMVYCKDEDTKKSDHFLGQAECDLNTLACGPEDVTLAVRDGDNEIGWAHMHLIFREEAELCAVTSKIEVDMPSASFQQERLYVKVIKRGGGDGRSLNTEHPRMVKTNGAVWQEDDNWEMPAHYFGVSVTRFMEECGFEFEIYESGTLSDKQIGHCNVLFSAHMPGGLLLSEIAVKADIQDNTGKIGDLTAKIRFSGLPKYVQMFAGKNIDGCVYGGKMISDQHPKPLNLGNAVERAGLV